MQSNGLRQPSLFPWIQTLRGPENEKRRAMLEKGWPQPFRDNLTPNLPVSVVAPYFCSNNGRPTKDLRTMMGLTVLQEMHDWTDKQTQLALSHDNAVRYALGIETGNDATLYVSRKTLHNFRAVIKNNNLHDAIFNETTIKLINEFNVDCTHMRMDSVHVKTRSKYRNRLELLFGTVKKFLKALKSEDAGAFKSLDKELVNRYLKRDESGFDYFGKVPPTQRERAIYTVAEDIFELYQRFRSNPKMAGLFEFSLLERIYGEQCRVGLKERIAVGCGLELKSNDELDPSALDSDCLEEPEDDDEDAAAAPEEGCGEPEDGGEDAAAAPEEGSGEPVFLGLKPPKEVGIDSLQSYTDPDVGYSAHKGKGMQVQLIETCSSGETADGDEPRLRLIVYRKAQKANEQDAASLIPALANLASRGIAPKVLEADTSYGGDANFTQAAAMGVELLAPVSGKGRGQKAGKPSVELGPADAARDEAQTASFAAEPAGRVEAWEDEPVGGPRGPVRLADFHSTADGVIKACPTGRRAETQRNQSGTGGRAHFDRAACMRCGLRGTCPVNVTGNGAWLTYKDVDVRLDKRRAYQETEAFKLRYRQRSGIEATNSELATTTGFKELRVRGLENTDYRTTFKVIGLNARRVINHELRKARVRGPRSGPEKDIRNCPDLREGGDNWEKDGLQCIVAS